MIEREGKILITRRPAGSHLDGFWEFPGGKAEARTRPPSARWPARCARSWASPSPSASGWPRSSGSYPDKQVRIEFFRGTIEGEPRPLEGQEMAWVAPAELGRYEFPPADAVLLERLRRP